MNSTPLISENCRRNINEDSITAKNNKESARLKATVADAMSENMRSKKLGNARKEESEYKTFFTTY